MSLEPPAIDPAFEAKRQEWIRCLTHRVEPAGTLDRNCILAQVYAMVWDAAAYRVVLEARRVAPRDHRGRVKLNPMLHYLLDRCFYQSQLVAVRRQLDSGKLDGNRGVFALSPLVRDMKAHRALFTRRNLFAAANRSLNVEAVAHAEREFLERQRPLEREFGHIPRELDAAACESLHREVDALCGVKPENRSHEDVVSEAVFTRLEAHLEGSEVLCRHVDKFLAHSATPESRAVVDADKATVSYGDLWKAHETIGRACQFIDGHLLRQMHHGFMSINAEDLLRFADQPLAAPDSMASLRKCWKEYELETESWAEDSLGWIVAPPGASPGTPDDVSH